MSESKVREPRQQRSIEKKKKIIEAGFKLFCEKGYHKTNTAQIAKKAGVSTGIVYNYFHNKKEIFMVCLKQYGNEMVDPVFELIETVTNKQDLVAVLGEVVERMIAAHISVQTLEEEFTSLQYEDPDVAEYYKNLEETIIIKIVQILDRKGIRDPHIHEKMHIVYNLVENLSHEVAYHMHESMNAEVMKNEVMKIIEFIIYNLKG